VQAYAEFVSVLKGCQGIELDEELSDVVSGNQFTWQDTQQTDLWDFANLSHRDWPTSSTAAGRPLESVRPGRRRVGIVFVERLADSVATDLA